VDNHHINLNPDVFFKFYDLSNYKLIAYFVLLNEKFLICLAFFLATFWIKWNTELFRFISFIVLSYIFILFLIFLSTPYDLYFQLDSTAARVIKSLSFLLAFFGLYNLVNHKIKTA
jgi:hypothetical protein